MPHSRLVLATLALTCLSWAALAQTAAPPPPALPAAPVIAAPAAAPAQAPAAPSAAAAPVAPTVPAPVAAAAADNTPVTRGELHDLVKDVLVNDPDILMQAVQKMREKQLKETQEQAKGALEKYHAALFNDPSSPSVGDAKTADVTLVEFFDYHCGYCKRLLPSVVKLVKEDSKVRVIFKEFPILSENSVTASRAALAVNKVAPDKYFDYHIALMQMNGKLDEKELLDAAKKLGINSKKVKEEMASKDITETLDKNRQMADDLGIRGTPALITVDTVIPGALSYEDLKKLVEDARSGKNPAEAPATAPAPTAMPKG